MPQGHATGHPGEVLSQLRFGLPSCGKVTPEAITANRPHMYLNVSKALCMKTFQGKFNTSIKAFQGKQVTFHDLGGSPLQPGEVSTCSGCPNQKSDLPRARKNPADGLVFSL